MNKESTFELVGMEKFLGTVCFFGDLMVMGTSFIHNLNNTQTLDKSLVREGLIYLQRRHPFLCAYLNVNKPTKQADNLIRRTINKYVTYARYYGYLIGLVKNKYEKQILKLIEQDVHDKIELEWLDLTNEKVDRSRINEESAKFNCKHFNYENNGLLWRVQVISYKEDDKLKYVINLVIHTVITDGLNIATLCIELMNILNALLEHKVCDEMKNKLAPVEDMYQMIKNRGLEKYPIDERVKNFNKNHPKAKFVLDKKFKSFNETGFKLDLFKIDKEITDKIIQVSKSKNVRLSGYFQAIAFYAMKNLYTKHDLAFPSRMPVEFPASLRVRYEPNLEFEHCRFHTTVVEVATDEDYFGKFEDFWSDAIYLHKLIQESVMLESGGLFTHTHDNKGLNDALVFIENYDDYAKLLHSENGCDLSVSNLGSFVNDRIKVYPGIFNIDELYFSDSLSSIPNILPGIIMHIMFWRGELMIQLGANKYAIGSSYVDEYKQFFIDMIHLSINN